MSNTVISVENLYKEYKLGTISHGTLQRDMQSWWAKARGKEDPNSLISSQHNEVSEMESFLALNDISFEVKAGERIGIIGKNGAGKSTLLKMLSRITSPTKGEIKIKGRIASLLEVGTGFHQELTGRENIYLNGAILGMKKWEITNKLDEIIDFSGVEKHIDTPVKRYSSGMNVRLGFAVAAHLEPEILVVDEVLSVGDAEFQKKALGKMENVSTQDGRTILFVSHNMAAVQQLCNKGLVLSKGTLIYSANALDAVEKYISNSDKTDKYESDGYIDLKDSREKLHQAKVFKKIRIINEKHSLCNSFPLLSKIIIEVELENAGKYPNADYCIAILNSNEQWMTSSASWMYPKKIKSVSNKMILEIPSIKFAPGSYRIYLSMTDHLAAVYIDKIENAASFDLEPSDIFNSGKEFTSDCGLFIPNGELIIK